MALNVSIGKQRRQRVKQNVKEMVAMLVLSRAFYNSDLILEHKDEKKSIMTYNSSKLYGCY